jgi:hypothetical protein
MPEGERSQAVETHERGVRGEALQESLQSMDGT